MINMLPDWTTTPFHSGAAPWLSTPNPALGEHVTVRVQLSADAPVQAVYLRTFPDGEQKLTPMTPCDAPPGALCAAAPLRWWQGELPIREPLVPYRFLLAADDGLWWLTGRGVELHEPLDSADFRIIADCRPPSWLPDTVFYQIFPDRFANGDPANDPHPDDFSFRGHQPRTFAWGSPPDPDQPSWLTFYGGDLPGILQRLDYVQELGINALYLNPVFTAVSNHKYDVGDYTQVDSRLGGDAALIALREALTARNMRYILDVVPNHCGYAHPWFQAALRDPAAPEADFFTFHHHPDSYESWLGVWSLPKLNYGSAVLRDIMISGEGAVLKRWLQPPFGADGWRVDVANMLGRQGAVQTGAEIGRLVRQAVKASNPEAWLLAENFFDATAQLQGDQFDAVMNYMGFSKPLIFWLTGHTINAWGLPETVRSPLPWRTEALIATWQERQAVIPWQIALQQYNLLGSHDTPRIESLVQGNRALHKLAALVQFAFPGVPGLYYGDEIGMQDEPLVGQRGCMVWDSADWDHDLRAFYQRLIALRRSSAALQSGSFRVVAAEQDSFAFLRQTADEAVLVIANRAPEGRAALPLRLELAAGVRFGEWFGGLSAEICPDGTLPLPPLPQGATLWVSRP